MTRNALLLLFLFRFSSVSLYCTSIRFSLASFMPVLISLLISLYLSVPPGLFFPFFSSPLLSHMSSSSVVTQDFFLRLLRITLAVSVIALLNLLVSVSVSCFLPLGW